MDEQAYLWLLARTYVALRLGYITTINCAVYDEIATVLTQASGIEVPAQTDSDILEFFRPRPVDPPAPVNEVDQPIKKARSK